MMHYGLFYDLISCQNIFNKSVIGIYKGKFKNISSDFQAALDNFVNKQQDD